MKTFETDNRLDPVRLLGGMGIALLIVPASIVTMAVFVSVPFATLMVIRADTPSSRMAAFLGLSFSVVAVALVIAGIRKLGANLHRLRISNGLLSVGADGIRWQRRWSRQFVPWLIVRAVSVQPHTNAIVIERLAGKPLVVDVHETNECVEELRAAWERWKTVPASLGRAELEVQRADGVPQWEIRAKQLLSRASYRDHAASVEELVAIAANSRANFTQRVGSALALSSAAAEEHARVRVAIGDIADAELAEAMAEALRGEVSTNVTKRLRRAASTG